MRRFWMRGAGMPAVLAGMLLIGLGIGDRWAEPEPADQWARFAGTTPVEGMAIVVERGDQRLVPGRETTYTIAVGNRARTRQTLTVQAALPPWLRLPATPDGAAAGDGSVDWYLTLAPGQVRTVELTGVYQEPGPATPERVALTACVLTPAADRDPVVCATDAGRLEHSGVAGIWWLAGGVGLAGLAGLAGWRWRRRRRVGRPVGP